MGRAARPMSPGRPHRWMATPRNDRSGDRIPPTGRLAATYSGGEIKWPLTCHFNSPPLTHGDLHFPVCRVRLASERTIWIVPRPEPTEVTWVRRAKRTAQLSQSGYRSLPLARLSFQRRPGDRGRDRGWRPSRCSETRAPAPDPSICMPPGGARLATATSQVGQSDVLERL